MPGAALGDRQEVVVVVAEHGAARQEPHLGHRLQLGDGLRHPRHGRRAVDRAVGRRIRGDGGDVAVREQAAAELALLVGENDARAGLARRPRRGESGRAPAHDQHVAVGVHLVVMVGVRLGRASAEAGRLADEVLVLHPERLRPHERLVVEAGRHEAREESRERHHVEIDARPGVHAARDEAVVELDLGRARVRHRAGAGLELHDRVGLLDAAGDDAPRPVIFPAPRDHADAVGEQRGGERVAGVALVAPAVEREREPRAAVDAAAGGQAAGLVMRRAPAALPRLVHRGDAIGDGVAAHVEPAPAAERVQPLLEVRAARVLAHEQVVAPLRVGQRVGVDRPRDVRLAAVGELALLARAAPGTFDQQHRRRVRGFNARRPPRRARRSGGP